MAEYRVMAETHTGGAFTLRQGFPTKAAAENHPVQLKHWRRVWVEEVPAKKSSDDHRPPLPWNVEWVAGRAYLVDATGARFASLLGTTKRREHVAEILCAVSQLALCAAEIVEGKSALGQLRTPLQGQT